MGKMSHLGWITIQKLSLNTIIVTSAFPLRMIPKKETRRAARIWRANFDPGIFASAKPHQLNFHTTYRKFWTTNNHPKIVSPSNHQNAEGSQTKVWPYV
jgi:hypothetical protein